MWLKGVLLALLAIAQRVGDNAAAPRPAIRVLAADIGNTLGCGAHLTSLRRTASGSFDVAEALDGQLLFEDEGTRALLSARITVEDALASVAKVSVVVTH